MTLATFDSISPRKKQKTKYTYLGFSSFSQKKHAEAVGCMQYAMDGSIMDHG